MNTNTEVTIYVWPNYEWCYPEDYQETLSNNSDDFRTAEVPLTVWEDDIDRFVEWLVDTDATLPEIVEYWEDFFTN